jgi:phosphomannomutase
MQSINGMTSFNELVQGCGFVGEVGRNLCCGQVMVLARAFGDFASPEGDGLFAIGHDVRSSSPSLAEAVSMGLRSGGHHVTHIGVCTKPLLEWYIDYKGLHGGIMITGGCGLPEWNGLRLYDKSARPVPASAVLESLETWDLNRLFSRPCEPELRHDAPLQAYVAHLRQRFRPATPINLCIDAGNGPAGPEIEAIVAHFPQMRLQRVGFEPDATFPLRGPDPFSPPAQQVLSNSVTANGCHLGAALDADCDLLSVRDEHGQKVPADVVGALLALALAPRNPGHRVLYGSGVRPSVLRYLSQAQIPTHPIDELPCATYAALRQGDACLYFDSIGHYAFGDFPGTANALLALLELINHLTASGRAMSCLVKEIDTAPLPDQTPVPTIGDQS